jgi:hypothetical protein
MTWWSNCNRLVGYDHRYAAADEVGCEQRQPIVLIFRPAVFNRNIAALDIAAFLEALEKWGGEVLVVIISGLSAEVPDHRHPWLLPPRRERPRRRAAKPRDELAPPHRSSSRPLHRQPIPDEDALERATSWLAADLAIEQGAVCCGA